MRKALHLRDDMDRLHMSKKEEDSPALKIAYKNSMTKKKKEQRKINYRGQYQHWQPTEKQ